MDDFCDCIDQWSRSEGDSRRHAFNLGQLLLKANPNSRGADGSTRGIFIIGDQSSSKSTTVNSVIKQVALQMGNNTVTKVRTWIEHRYDPELEDARYELLIEHDKPEKNETRVKGGTLQDLTKEFEKLNKDRMDDKKDARIIIHSNIPSFAIDCCDNPGLTPTNYETQTITDSITRRTLDTVLERQKSQNDSVVVLCISALVFENASWPRHMDLMAKIDGSNLIVLITRMDQLNVGGIAQEIRADEKFQKALPYSNSGSPSSGLRCSPWDILKYIRIKIERQAGLHAFPEGVQFHYASSSSENWDNLMKFGWNVFEESEIKNNNKMFEMLCEDKEEWSKHGIELVGMDPMQEREFEKSVGMMKLQERLLQTLHVHIVKAAEELINCTSDWKSDARMELDRMSKRIKPSKDRAELISEFCKQFILVFQTLFSSPLYTPTIHSDPWLKEFSEGIKRARETSTGYGWTLRNMWDIFESLKGTDGYAEFPPKDFRSSDFQTYMDNIEKYINPSGDRFNTAHMLIQRLTQEYTMRSTLIDLRELDVDEFVSRQVQARTSTQLSFGQAVDQKISEDYGRIFHAHERENVGRIAGSSVEGGNQWVSVFGALCLLLHAEYTIRIMRDTAFSSLLQAQNDDPMHGILISRFERYWKHKYKNKNSTDKQSTEDQIAKIMTTIGKTNSKKKSSSNKVSPVEDLSWALYTMFFENPYSHFKRTLDERTDLLVMTHATSLVHFYQLSGICVHQDEGYLLQWAANNPNSEYVRAFLVTEQDVKEGIDAFSKLGIDAFSKLGGINGISSDITKPFLTLLAETLQKFQKGKETNKESQRKPAIFSSLSESITDRVRSIVKSKPPGPEDKVKLLIDIADMGRSPDTFEEPESKTSFSEKEEASVNYIYRRRLTMGITSSVIDATQQLAKVQYEYSHQQTAPALQRELLGRVASLMLGYEYPYHPDARPSSCWYLSPKVIVQFLLTNEDVLESMYDSPEERYEWKALLDPRMLESPIVKRMISLCNPTVDDNHNFRTVSNHIKRLETAKRDQMDSYIIEFLADDRFNWLPDQENLQRRANNLKEDIMKFSKWHDYLEAYKEVAEAVLLGREDREPIVRFNMEEIATELEESEDEDDE